MGIKTKQQLTDELKAIKRGVNAGNTDVAGTVAKVSRAIAEAGAGGIEPSPGQKAHAGATLDYLAENVERQQAMEAARTRTREEWEALEAQHIDFNRPAHWTSLETVFDNAMRGFDVDELWFRYNSMPDGPERDEVREQLVAAGKAVENELGRYRPCAYVFCHGVFASNRATQKYCCEAHKYAQKDAEARFQATGTYLPQDAYLPKRGKKAEEVYQAKVIPLFGEVLDAVVDRQQRKWFGRKKICRKVS